MKTALISRVELRINPNPFVSALANGNEDIELPFD